MGILLLRFRGNPYQKFLFLLFVFSFTYVSFLVFLISSKTNLILLAYLYRTGSPFQYMISISFFLLSKAIGRRRSRPTPKDLLWFIIPFLNVLELLPYYLSDVDQKLLFLKGLRTDQNIAVFNNLFTIPVSVHYMLQVGLGFLLYGATFLSTYKYRRVHRKTNRINKLLWINTLSLFMTICFGLLFLIFIADNSRSTFHTFSAMIFAFTLIIVGLSLILEIFLIQKPLFSIPVKANDKRPDLAKSQVTEEEINFKKLLENYFRSDSGYLKASFRIQDLADAMQISRNSLSYLINTVYNRNFNELVNEKRIEVVLEKMEDPKWQNLSLQGIAEEVGFKSRTTFNKAFKNKTGYTYTEFRAR